MKLDRRTFIGGVAASTLLSPSVGHAQAYPERPINLILPYALAEVRTRSPACSRRRSPRI